MRNIYMYKNSVYLLNTHKECNLLSMFNCTIVYILNFIICILLCEMYSETVNKSMNQSHIHSKHTYTAT